MKDRNFLRNFLLVINQGFTWQVLSLSMFIRKIELTRVPLVKGTIKILEMTNPF